MTTLAEHLLEHARRHPHGVAWRKKRLGRWYATTWEQALHTVEALAEALGGLGVGPEQPLVVVADWDPQVLMIDLATQSLGAWPIALSPLLSADELIARVASSEARIAVCGDSGLVPALTRRRADAGLDRVLAIESSLALPGEDAVETLEALLGGEPRPLAERIARCDGDAIAFVGLTAGTSGPPKDVTIRQRDAVAAAAVMAEHVAMTERDRVLCHLPLTHPLGRILAGYAALVAGASLNFPQGRETLISDMDELGPTLVLAPPRLLEALHALHVRKLGASRGTRRKVADRATAWLGRVWARRTRPTALDSTRRRLAQLVFARWVRKRLGLRDVRRIACLGAVRDDLVPFYWSLGVGVSELYAKAALGGLLAARSTLDPGLSAVPGVELREEADGELAVHGPWGAPGWQRTGDRGDLGAAVIGRLEETVVLPGGGIVAIGQIERAVAASPYVARAVAAMDGLGGVTVVVEPDFETIAMWRHRLDLAQVVAHRVVEERVLIERVEADVRQAIAALSIPFELRRVRLIGRELDVARDELTPLGTVRRRRVQEEFDEEPPMRSIAAR